MNIFCHETPSDIAAIHVVNKQAFESRESGPNLVKAIRNSEEFVMELSLVAEVNEQIVGRTAYHPQFGFSAASAKSLECSVVVCSDTWMALALVPNAFQAISGKVVYPAAFNGV